MDFINFHIAYLLTEQEQVIIPDFGAFVVSKANDNKSGRQGIISPPVQYSLSFNPEIIQDDGMLVHSIEKEKNIGYTEALHLVYEYVDSLVDNLRAGQAVQFPWIGKIQLSDGRKIVFTPATNLSCNASNCGLVNINFPCLDEVSEEQSVVKKRKKIYERPVFYIILAVIVLSLALLFVLKTFNPLEVLKNYSQATSHILTTNSVQAVIDTLPMAQTDSVKPELVVADSTKLSPEYFIIVSSMTTKKEAEIMLKYFQAQGLDESKIIRSDGKYRISIETFTDKDRAVSFLDILKKDGTNPLFKEAWILESQGQLTVIFEE